MKTTCPHCTQHLSHDAPKEITAISCPTCAGPVLLRPARSWLWLRCLGYAAAVVIFILIFSGVIGDMERSRIREDRRAEYVRQRSERWGERAASVSSRQDLYELQRDMRQELEADKLRR